tara:strand:- start:501 stop:1436 length:936 start_codon:yes stop_codon:yes gene_type:complete
LGAIKNWVELQKESECIFCIVDLHSITNSDHIQDLKNNTYEVLAAYIASGIDSKKNIIFNQSSISGHSELSWLLSCRTPIGWLNRMTQFKDKAGKNKEKASVGLYSYPILMAADILLYKATHVPVGDDQKQHLELCRDIAQSFNRFYNIDFFPIPEPLISEKISRIMSLKDGKKKMSKSDESDFSRINLNDNEEQILKKLKKAKTDSQDFPKKEEELSQRPEIKNLIGIYSSLANISIQEVMKNYSSKSFSDLKLDLAELVKSEISPISSEMKKLMNDKKYLKDVLKNGEEKALEISQSNLKRIKEIIGLI